jgi:hypothetical protein
MRAAQIANRESDLRFPVRIRIAAPASGLGERLNQMHSWLEENCGATGWAMAPSGMRGVVNDALAIYFLGAAIAGAFVARWCAGRKPEIDEGAFMVREDAPAPRIGAKQHKTP